MHKFTVRMFHIHYEYVFVFMCIYFSTGLLNHVSWVVSFYKIW